MTKFGVAISQSGTPIEKASDYQRIIDTRWKTMAIVSITPVSIDDVFGTARIIKLVDHNLGFIPAYEVPYYNTRFEAGTFHSSGYLFLADRTSIYLVITADQSLESGYTMVGNIIVYDLNMELDYVSDRSGLVAATSRTNRGIKIIGNDQYAAHDANDTDPLGFAITTDAKAIGVDQVGTVRITGGDLVGFTVLGRGVISHNLSYPPLVKTAQMYTKNSAGNIIPLFISFPAPSDSITYYGPLVLNYAKVESQRVVLQSYTDDVYRFVLFKEPTEIAG